jgi:hypothetical protein
MTQVAALIVVGVVSDGFARHLVQSAPIWIAMTAGVYGARWAKWAALPVFLFWIAIAVLIWLFLLGIARIATGTYSDVEIAMTIVFALAGMVGIVVALRERSGTPVWVALLIFVVVGALQVGALNAGLHPPLSSDTALLAWLHGS